MRNILITGGTGFIAKQLIKTLQNKTKMSLTATARRKIVVPGVNFLNIPSLNPTIDWSEALFKQDVVVHVAGAHNIKYEFSKSLTKYRKFNVDTTINLARQAINAGVKRFIFISSIKVNGEITNGRKKFSPEDNPAPESEYGISKLEAERGLQALSKKSAMDIVIVRPALVYGPQVGGNFNKLAKLVLYKIPLPFGAIYNKRTLIALDNLVDLIITCINHNKAANQIFLAGDAQDLSTTELLQLIAKINNKPSYLLPIPSYLLISLLSFFGKKNLAKSIFRSLQLDISKNYELLNWYPKISVEEGIRRCFNKK